MEEEEHDKHDDGLAGGGALDFIRNASSSSSVNWWWPFSWFFAAESKNKKQRRRQRRRVGLDADVTAAAERACRYVAHRLPLADVALIHEYKKETQSSVPYKIINYLLNVAGETAGASGTAVMSYGRGAGGPSAVLRGKSRRDIAALVEKGHALNKALHGFPRLRTAVTVWRGTNARLRSQKNPNKFMSKGEHLHFAQFMSTTLDPATALRFARFRSPHSRTDLIIWRIEVAAGFPFPFITQKVRLRDGVPQANTCFSDEYEVLFPAGAVLRLRDRPRLLDMRAFGETAGLRSRDSGRSQRRVFLCTLVLEGFLRSDSGFWRQLSARATRLADGA